MNITLNFDPCKVQCWIRYVVHFTSRDLALLREIIQAYMKLSKTTNRTSLLTSERAKGFFLLAYVFGKKIGFFQGLISGICLDNLLQGLAFCFILYGLGSVHINLLSKLYQSICFNCSIISSSSKNPLQKINKFMMIPFSDQRRN